VGRPTPRRRSSVGWTRFTRRTTRRSRGRSTPPGGTGCRPSIWESRRHGSSSFSSGSPAPGGSWRSGRWPGTRRSGSRGRSPRTGVLPSLELDAPFDAVFIDADKGNYDAYGRWATKVLRPGGLLLADNVYLFGKLMGKSLEAAAMRRFHEESARAFDTVCIPTPDGLLLGVKR